MLCKKCNEREIPLNRQKHGDYICYKCEYNRLGPEKQRKYRHKLRNQVLDHYGRQCVYCGTQSDLQLDHTNGDGKNCRTTTAKQQWFRFLISEHYPPICQVVCGQCNRAKGSLTHEQFKEYIELLYARFQSDF